MMDAEIAGMYSTMNITADGDTVFYDNQRTVVGFDANTVLGNTSIQGEYAELSVDGKDASLGDDPKAIW
jgi:hypothetical protein